MAYSRINNYVFRQLILAALLITASLTAIVWLTQSLRLVDFIVNRGVEFTAFLHLAVLTLPGLLPVILPIAVFVSVLFVFYRLGTDSELMVMRAGGLSPRQIARPALRFAVLVTAFTYCLTIYLAPISYTAFKDLQFKLRNDFSMTLLEEGVFTQISKGITVFVRERASDGTLQGILVHDNRDPNIAITWIAENGNITMNRGNPRISIANGSRQTYDRRSKQTSLLYLQSYTLELSELFPEQVNRKIEPREMPLGELLFPDPKMDRIEAARLVAVGHQRLLAPLNTISFTLIAVVLMVSAPYARRQQTSRLSVAVCLAILLQASTLGLYNSMDNYTVSLGMPVLIFAYAVTIAPIFILLGFAGFYRVLPLPKLARQS